MSRKTVLRITTFLFTLIAAAHLLRIIQGWSAVVGGVTIPFWASWIAVVVAGTLAYKCYRHSR